ncbi:MAG: Holliday junction branch migration protein RuvA [Corynebacterium sp.]|uniref:Holliday junction branch migration protein RuvA n=1 Tax=unclassified Corynebacterium TaxID=2624378 RepID=UPI002649F9D8|nr:Holliday junction branch migration protein RuvA [Corynebacterium sp.]MDN5718940.1 Holliday junction branch migration protein RuvA [Corynebacterium sp.]MDN6326190.1 Holliday junction branch migration protein RuvA [Corynebacterium sp.]
MIASLRGTVIDKRLDSVVIECAGVGYQCQATAPTLATLPRGEEVFVLTTMVVREDSQTLFAFPDVASREVFGLLQSVSGVGARLAMGVMSVLDPAELSRAVTEGDVKALQRAPGVGKRLAERMAVDLKGKLDGYAVAPTATAADGGVGQDEPLADAVPGQVVDALTGLGFTERDAEKAVREISATGADGDGGAAEPADTATVLRRALAHLGGRR